MHLITEDLIGEFLLVCRQRGLATATIERYRWHLHRFAAACMNDPGWSAGSIGASRRGIEGSLRRWNAGLHDHYAPATIKQAICAARAYLRWLHQEGHLAADLSACLSVPRIPRQVQRTITPVELATLLAVAGRPADHGLTEEEAAAVCARNSAITALLFDTLLRAGELCRLELRDLDLEHLTLIVRRGKGGSSRKAYYSTQTAAYLCAWLIHRQDAPQHLGAGALFIGIRGDTPGQPLTPSGLRNILRKLGERAGLEGVSPHAFRRGGAVALTLNGAPSRIVQILGGWSDIQMVERYTRSLDDASAAAAAVARYSPVAAVVAAQER